MKVVDIADEIYFENGEASDTAVSSIAYWVRSNVGRLNSYLLSTYSISANSLEIQDEDGAEIGINEAAILKKMWMVDRYNTMIRTQLTSISAGDDLVSISDEQSTYERANKSEIIKSLRLLKDGEVKELNDLINDYNLFGTTPTQVAGDDTVDGSGQVYTMGRGF